MSLLSVIVLYVLCTLISLFPFYYIVSHLLYSNSIYLNLLSIVLLACCSLFHFVVFRTGVIPLLNIDISGDGSMFFVLIPFACAYSYVIPFNKARTKYYLNR